MKTSQVVDRWRAEGQLEPSRDDLVALLESRCGSLPKDLIQRIRGIPDTGYLHRAFQQAPKPQSLADLQL